MTSDTKETIASCIPPVVGLVVLGLAILMVELGLHSDEAKMKAAIEFQKMHCEEVVE